MRRPTFASTLAFATALGSLCHTVAARAATPIDADSRPALAQVQGEVAADRVISVAIVLRGRDQAGLDDLIRRQGTRGDPLYHQYLQPAEFAARFGATQADLAAVTAWATQQGLTVGASGAGRLMVMVTGKAGTIGSAFGVHFANYRAPANGRVFYAADAMPRMPDALAPRVSAALGFSDAVHNATLVRPKPASVPNTAGGTGPGGAYSARDLRTAYAIAPQSPATHTESIALYEQGGYDPDDIATYVATNRLRAVPVVPRLINNFGGGINDPQVALEAALDIDLALGVNDELKQVLVYEDGDDPFGVSLLACLDAMASDNVAQTVSISYGVDEGMQSKAQLSAEHKLLQQLAAQGVAVFVSAGDDGAYGRTGVFLNAPDPGAQPYVTSVGGTTLFTGPGAGYSNEEVWNNLSFGGGGTGGGVSKFWKIPRWQKPGDTSVAITNGGSATMRNVPDVAADANPLTGVSVYSKLNGGWLQIGGTSASAPIWASFYSSVNASSKALGFGPIGFFNPSLYAFTHRFTGFGLHDVVYGSNGYAAIYGSPGYNAGALYDNTTGFGSPYGVGFILDYLTLELEIRPRPNAPPPVTNLSATTPTNQIDITWAASPGATGYFVTAYNQTQAQTLLYAFTSKPSAIIATALPGSVYFLEVYAVNARGAVKNSIFVSTPPRSFDPK